MNDFWIGVVSVLGLELVIVGIAWFFKRQIVDWLVGIAIKTALSGGSDE